MIFKILGTDVRKRSVVYEMQCLCVFFGLFGRGG